MMKPSKKQAGRHWLDAQTLEQFRHVAREQMLKAELEGSPRLEAMDRIIDLMQLDAAVFHELWLRPLLEAGASLDMATTCIVESWLQPN